MMKLGFMSFLLTLSEDVPISKICINKAVANSFLPCKDSADNYLTGLASASATRDSTTQLDKTPPTNDSAYEVNYCEAKVGLINSFIFIYIVGICINGISHVEKCPYV